MAEQKKTKKRPKQFNKLIIILFIILIVIIVFAGGYRLISAKQEEKEAKEIMQAQEQNQADYNARLQEIQDRIDKQKAVIDEINEKLEPLVEERTNLEMQMSNLTQEK